MVLEEKLQNKGFEAAGFVDVHEANYKVGDIFQRRITSILIVFSADTYRRMGSGS